MVGLRNILVTGSDGQIGRSIKDLASNYSYNIIFKKKCELNIINYVKFEEFLNENKINTLINCAAFTDVNYAEIKRKTANKINHLAVNHLAELCSKFKIQLIHISTDYVFDGKKTVPYNEYDKVNPLNYYGITKLSGENKILRHKLKNSIIIRTSWLYSKFKNNFVKKILKKSQEFKEIYVVKDEIGSPTNACDLGKVILDIIPKIKNENVEIYHFSNKGFCSRYEFAKEIIKIVNADTKLKESMQKENRTKRPKFSPLDSQKISYEFDLDILSWSESLKKYLHENTKKIY